MQRAGPEGEMAAGARNARRPNDMRFTAITTSAGVVVSAVLTAIVTYAVVQKPQSATPAGANAPATPGGQATSQSTTTGVPCPVAQIKAKLSTFGAAYDGLIAVTTNDTVARTRNPSSPNNAVTKRAVDQAMMLKASARTELDQAIEDVGQQCVALK